MGTTLEFITVLAIVGVIGAAFTLLFTRGHKKKKDVDKEKEYDFSFSNEAFKKIEEYLSQTDTSLYNYITEVSEKLARERSSFDKNGKVVVELIDIENVIEKITITMWN